MIPMGERRLLESLNADRGFHELRISYKTDWPKCAHCKQAIRTDPELAYRLFLEAALWWDGRAISHNKLRDILLGIEGDIEFSSNGKFRDPQNYGLDPFREWGRRVLGETGIVLADIDTGLRRYGKRFGLGPGGDAMLIEKKERWPS